MKIVAEKWFHINEELTVQCVSFTTRTGWGHIARGWSNGKVVGEKKINYQNRTWERYTYETVLFSLVSAMDSTKEVSLKNRVEFYNFIKNQ